MALTACPECGKRISKRVSLCPDCGKPLQQYAASAGPANSSDSAARKSRKKAPNPPSEYSASALKCPHCKAILGPKDLLSKDWAECPQCGESVLLGGGQNAFSDNNVIERLFKLPYTKDYYHKVFMQHLMDKAGVDVFDNLKIISQRYVYFWAREYGQGRQRAVYPMCKYGKQVFNRLFPSYGYGYINAQTFDDHYNPGKMVFFNKDDIRDTELIGKEHSSSENRLDFSHTDIGHYTPTPVYYCLPVVEEVVEYRKTRYTFIAPPDLLYDAMGRPCFSMDNFPGLDFLSSKAPAYTNIKPVTKTAKFLFVLIVLFILGFFFYVTLTIYKNTPEAERVLWVHIFMGVLLQAFIGSIAYIVARLCKPILYLLGYIDIAIRSFVNQSIRQEFRMHWQQVQEHKRWAAKRNLGLDLTYTVPPFPIPKEDIYCII